MFLKSNCNCFCLCIYVSVPYLNRSDFIIIWMKRAFKIWSEDFWPDGLTQSCCALSVIETLQVFPPPAMLLTNLGVAKCAISTRDNRAKSFLRSCIIQRCFQSAVKMKICSLHDNKWHNNTFINFNDSVLLREITSWEKLVTSPMNILTL